MSEINKVIFNAQMMKELGAAEVGKAFGDVIRKYPEKAILIGGGLVGLYLLKDKKIKFKLKRTGDFEFKAE